MLEAEIKTKRCLIERYNNINVNFLLYFPKILMCGNV
jgi:hypothetical protein